MQGYIKLVSIVVLVLQGLVAVAQNYHGMQGSNYAGSLGLGNNPASIVNTPYPWDITIFGIQEKHATNAVTLYKYSLLSSPANSEYLFDGGNYSRFAHINFNVNLLNARIALNRQSAFAFGMNIRGYTRARTSAYNFVDTLHSARDFFDLGNSNRDLEGNMTSSSWIELFGTYSRTIWDRPADRLNAGVTLKVSRGLSGAHLGAANFRANLMMHNSGRYYELASAQLQYGYSANYDKWSDDKSTGQNINDFFAYTSGGASLDLGVEYLIKPPGESSWDEDNYYDYDWKIGVSLLDLGFNQYKYGRNSRALQGVRENITDSLFDQKINGADNFTALNDSISDMVVSSRVLEGAGFKIMNPARLVVNVDRYLFDAFYINGDLTINLSSLARNKLRVSELNMLTITPRWEIRRFGFFMPMMLNAEGKFWVGGAFKVGPLLLGIHNWGNVFSKNKMQNGGGYLALVIRPGKIMGRGRADKRYDCPE